MNTNTYFKKIVCLIVLCGLVSSFLCSCQKEYKYPITSTDYQGELFLPHYVPDGYEYNGIESSSALTLISYTSPYDELCFVQLNSHDHTVSLDNEHSDITEYKSERFTGYLLTDQNIESSHLIYIYDDKYTFEIFGIIDKNELIKMVESIAKYEP